jgi:hypothetical protein
VTRSSDYELEMVLNVHPADPFHAALQLALDRGPQQPTKSDLSFPLLQVPLAPSNSPQLIAAMAIDLAERKRTKLAGNILGAEKQNNGLWKVRLEVTQALG